MFDLKKGPATIAGIIGAHKIVWQIFAPAKSAFNTSRYLEQFWAAVFSSWPAGLSPMDGANLLRTESGLVRNCARRALS